MKFQTMKLDSPPQKATLKLLAADQTKKLELVRKVYTENANKVLLYLSRLFALLTARARSSAPKTTVKSSTNSEIMKFKFTETCCLCLLMKIMKI